MTGNIIRLQFDKSLSCLASNPYGKTIYDEQVRGRLDSNKKNIIEFPSFIDDIAISFIQGFFKNIVKEMGFGGFMKKVEIRVSSEELHQKILDNILGMQ